MLFDAMPNRAGLVPATPEFVDLLREETRRRGILLIHDEIITFRVAFGGLQSMYGLEPDITTLGKVIGGGHPIGAVGGRAELMDIFDPAVARPPRARRYVLGQPRVDARRAGVARAPHRRGDRSHQCAGRSSAPGAARPGVEGGRLAARCCGSIRAIRPRSGGALRGRGDDRRQRIGRDLHRRRRCRTGASRRGLRQRESRCLSALRCASSGVARPGWPPPCTRSAGG